MPATVQGRSTPTPSGSATAPRRAADRSFGSFTPAAHVPELDETQRSIVAALDREGYVTLPFTALAGEERWTAVEEQGAAFIAETERTIAEGGQGKIRDGKEFVVRRWSFEGKTARRA